METIKRKRGRPRKNPIPEPPPVVKKKRGRPPKVKITPAPPPPPPPVVVAEPPPGKRRGRPPKIKVAEPIVKNYYVVAPDDILFWAQTTEREMFKQAAADYIKMKKSKAHPEIRWYVDRIEVVSA
jgi:hypothetical protein